MRDRLESSLRDIAPDLVIHGVGAPRLANTSCVGMPGVSGDENVQRPSVPGAIFDRLAKLPGVVPAAWEDGFSPSGGNER